MDRVFRLAPVPKTEAHVADVAEAAPAPSNPKLGYEINYKAIGLAYLIEIAVIGAGAYAGWQFAQKYTGHDLSAWWMAIIATAAISVAELARVPLAQLSASQKNLSRKILAWIGVLMMVAVTTKALSQVMEQMFHPRLHQVQIAANELHKAEAAKATLVATRNGPAGQDKNRSEQLARLDEQIAELTKRLAQFGKPPQQRQECRTVRTRTSQQRSCRWVTPSWQGSALMQQIADARAKRDTLIGVQQQGQKALADMDREIALAEETVTARKADLEGTVMDSQLHSFTAMIFGKDPLEVTNGELHWFLRIFVFLPAIMIASASTLLAFCAYTVNKPAKPTRVREPVKLTRALGEHINRVAGVHERLRRSRNRWRFTKRRTPDAA